MTRLTAFGPLPFLSGSTSQVMRWPSISDLRPARSTAVMCTNPSPQPRRLRQGRTSTRAKSFSPDGLSHSAGPPEEAERLSPAEIKLNQIEGVEKWAPRRCLFYFDPFSGRSHHGHSSPAALPALSRSLRSCEPVDTRAARRRQQPDQGGKQRPQLVLQRKGRIDHDQAGAGERTCHARRADR